MPWKAEPRSVPMSRARRVARGTAILATAMIAMTGTRAAQDTPRDTGSAAAQDGGGEGEDIIVLGRRLPLENGEWTFEFIPPRQTSRYGAPSAATRTATPQADGGDTAMDSAGASPPEPPPPDLTDRPSSRIWRACLVGGDAVRMMNQLAAVARKPSDTGKRPGAQGPRCGEMKLTLTNGRMAGEQKCRERVVPRFPELGRPLGEMQESTFRIDGRYHPDRFSMMFRSTIMRASLSGDGSFDNARESFGDETVFSLEARRIGGCPAADAGKAATKP